MPGEDIVKNVTDKVVEEGKGWFSKLTSIPGDFLKGLFGGTTKSLMGAGKGLISGAFNLFGVLTTGGVLWGLTKFAPSAVVWASDKLGKFGKDGKTLAEQYVADEKAGGGKALMDIGLAAVLINSGMGIVSGSASGAADSATGEDRSFMEKAGAVLGSGVLLIGGGLLAFNKIKSTQIGAAEPADGGTKIPPVTPPKAPENKANAQTPGGL